MKIFFEVIFGQPVGGYDSAQGHVMHLIKINHLSCNEKYFKILSKPISTFCKI